MRIADMLFFAVSTLWQQKARTLLTTLGVLFGSFVLAASLSINHGVQKTIDRFVKQNDALRKINVSPEWSFADDDASDSALEPIAGAISDATRQRLQKALKRRITQYRNRAQSASECRHAETPAGFAAR